MENKTSKYFKYAIGEIILVVIGILIALSINNWNVTKNNNEYVSLMLKEIYYDLSDDYRIIYEGIEPRLEIKLSGTEELKALMVKGKAPSDFIFMNAYAKIGYGFSLTQRTGAFEALKLGGLDKIKNDSLRTLLLQFYESSLPRSVIFITEDDENIAQQIGVLESDIFHFKFMAINDSILTHVKRPKIKNYLNHQSLHKIYNLVKGDVDQKMYRLKSLKNNYKKIMRMIEKELEKRKVSFEYFDTSILTRDFSDKTKIK